MVDRDRQVHLAEGGSARWRRVVVAVVGGLVERKPEARAVIPMLLLHELEELAGQIGVVLVWAPGERLVHLDAAEHVSLILWRPKCESA